MIDIQPCPMPQPPAGKPALPAELRKTGKFAQVALNTFDPAMNG
jgi:hypothetical protein